MCDMAGAPVMSETAELNYLLLADRAVPYLLARVRWPDVAQAISANAPDWLDDPGLFDLPYDPSAVVLSFPQAASVAAGWGRHITAEPAEGVPSYIRRMPANWSDLSPSEQRTWGIEFVGRRHAPDRGVPRLRLPKAKISLAPAGQPANEQAGETLGNGKSGESRDNGKSGEPRDNGKSGEPRGNGKSGAPSRPGGAPGSGPGAPTNLVPIWKNRGPRPSAVASSPRRVAIERRRHARVGLDGSAHIRCEDATISAALVDLSECGMRCVMYERSQLIASDATLGGPFLLEAEVLATRICLDVVGDIAWHRKIGADTHFGISFAELATDEAEGVQRFLAATKRKRGRR